MRMSHALLHLPHPMYSPARSSLFILSPSPRLPFSIPVICINILFHFVLSQSIIIKGLLFHVFSLQTWTRVPSSTLVPSTLHPPFPQRPSHVLKPTDQTQSPHQRHLTNQPNCGRMLCLRETYLFTGKHYLLASNQPLRAAVSLLKSRCLFLKPVLMCDFKQSLDSIKEMSGYEQG